MQDHQKINKKRLLDTIMGLILAFAVIFAVCCAGFALEYHSKTTRCTAQTTAIITNYKSITVYEDGRHRKVFSADIVTEGDGVFPAQTIHTNSTYYAGTDTVVIFYDPSDTNYYYFDGEPDRICWNSKLFGILSAAAFAVSIFGFVRSRRAGQNAES